MSLKPSLDDLRATWIHLYDHTLPSLARSNAPAQPRWPVTFGHCFARIILDHTVGGDEAQWQQRLKQPAVKNMSEEQLMAAIELGGKIERGAVGLVELDRRSLRSRGKNGKYENQEEVEDSSRAKRKLCSGDEGSPGQKRVKITSRQSTIRFAPRTRDTSNIPLNPGSTSSNCSNAHVKYLPPDYKLTLRKISCHSTLTPYRRRLYRTLLSVPAGRYTTYKELSIYLASSARAVGNGMRNNPFAPAVPCHRVLAADGSIGGFKGDWGREGAFAAQKIELLRSEGVRFDGQGKVIGEPFRCFHNFADG